MDIPVAVPPMRRAALAFIFITVLIDILAFGVIIPVLPHMIKQLVGGGVSEATLWHGLFATSFMVMQFLFMPMQGALSDHYGRRPVLLLSNLGLGVDFVIMALAGTLPLLFIGRLLSGMVAASFSTANAYVADVTPPEQRAAAFGKLGMAFGLGFVIAPVAGSWLGLVDLRLPFWIAAALCLLNFLYGWWVLPESLPPERRVATDWKRANPVGALLLLRRYPQVWGLAGVVFLSSLAHLVYPTTFVLYADYRFGWGLDMVGWTLLLVGLLSIVVQGGLIGVLVKKLGERRTLLFGLGCGALGFALYGLAPNGYWFWAAMPIAALWGVAGPAAQAMMTRQVDAHEQGRLQGALASVSSVAGMLGPTLFTQTLAVLARDGVRDVWTGATFWLASVLVALSLGLAWRSTRLAPVVAATPR